ncbi:MAG: putative bifunctional diguanylate cyclase/phosphodiesterase [Armatimonadota bacterium]
MTVFAAFATVYSLDTPFLVLLLIAALVASVLAIIAWRQRPAAGAGTFALLMVATAQWSLTYALSLGSDTFSHALFWDRCEYLGIVTIPFAWLLFTLCYTGRSHWLTRRNIGLLLIIPVITLGLVFTDDVHHLIYHSVSLMNLGSLHTLDISLGAAFVVHAAYSYLLLLIGTVILFQAYLSAPALYRSQVAAMLIGALVPWIANIADIFDLHLYGSLDMTPFAFTLTGITVAWALFHFKFLDITPISGSAVITGLSDGVVVLDRLNRVIDMNPAAQRVIGCSLAEAMGQPVETVFSRWSDILAFYRDATETRDEVTIETDGQLAHYELRITPLFDQHHDVIGRLVVTHDITERKRAEEHLNFLAYYDDLTGLPNRFLFTDRLQNILARTHRRYSLIAVMFIDLDRFKEVNDSLGHNIGDKLLCEVARRLTECVREGDTVARMGGDEFVLILTDLKDAGHDAETTALRVLASFDEPFLIEDYVIDTTPSIGITVAPDDGSSVDSLMKNADLAMYRAKEEGKNTFRFFSSDMSEILYERRFLGQELRKALEGNQFKLVYQPQVDIHSGNIVGVEALLRWDHPDYGEISPQHFIPLAEETGLIEPIGAWVLQTACTQAQAWHQAGCTDLRMAVNLSARQFERQYLVKAIDQALAVSELAPEFLELEITESTAMRDTEYAIELLVQLREMGMRIAIDDFGTGHCSFGYLKRFPVDTLKINQTFIRDIPDHHDSVAIAHAIVILGRSLGLTLIAECVETTDQLEMLRTLGCHMYQGFLFSKPLSAEECGQLILQRQPAVLVAR